jgi:hypothetical protein
MCTNTHYLYVLHAYTLKTRTAHTRCLNACIMHLFWVLLLYTVVTTTGQISLAFHRSPPKLRHLSRRGTSCRVPRRSCVTTRLVTTIPPGHYVQNCDCKHVVSALETDDDRLAPDQGCMQDIPKCFTSSYDEIMRHENLFSG